jgi:hypothetical protein|tara:strand:- start:4358 stop:4630 length:273 start_codon:yes stop_codon:yes gene_type:complete
MVKNIKLENGEVIIVCETEAEWEIETNMSGGMVVYHPEEIKELKGLDRDEVLQLHEAKKIFDGFLGGSPPEKKKKNSLSDMRKKCRPKKA